MILLYYFLAGLLLDVLITLGWYSLEKKWVFASTLCAMAQTVLGYTVYYNLFPNGLVSEYLGAFTVGGGLGVAVVVFYRKYWGKEID